MSALILPNINPVALQLGPLAIRWYSLAYIFGLLATMFFLNAQNKKHKIMSQQAEENWLIWAVFSIVLGGRFGYVLFYNFDYFLENKLEIFAVWHGGMSFHGGLLGAIFGMWFFCRKYKINFLQLTDSLAIIAPVGLFFGRIANFINMELYGRATESNFGVVFPNAGNFPRHPSQLYEASLEGILLFAILFSLSKFSKIQQRFGALSGVFLVSYGISRIIVENFREPDEQIGLLFGQITMGQALSTPLILFGIFLIFNKKVNFGAK